MSGHTFISYLTTVIARGACKKHSVEKFIPCFTIHTSGGRKLPAVCNHRAKQAGFYGTPSKSSLRQK